MQNSCKNVYRGFFRYIVVNTLHKGDNSDDDGYDNNNNKYTWCGLSQDSVVGIAT